MRVCIYGDNHFSQYSSIVRKRGSKYSVRLENQIKSLNWVEDLASQTHCESVICLGDFFDKADLNSEELTALNDIEWNYLPHYFIVGNHEMGLSTLEYSSAHLLNLRDRIEVVDKPKQIKIGDAEICLLPYVLESDRKTIAEYFPEHPFKDRFGLPVPRIILSHNDIKGIQMGQFESPEGFEVSDIEANCDLFINGHLHNGMKVTDKIINCGNLTGQNFSEDANKYDHIALVLDIDSLRCEVYENPYALNFYKIDVTKWAELGTLQVKHNAVCTVKCRQRDVEAVKEWIASNNHIIESRVLIEPELDVQSDMTVESLSVDHLEQFRQYILSTMGSTEVVVEELAEVLK